MNTNSINSRNWELLLNALDEGRVVPVIGDALIMVKGPDGKEENVTDYLMRRLQERFKAPAGETLDFSQIDSLIEASNARLRNIGDYTDIYYEIYDCLQGVEVRIPPFLEELFRECRFPLTLTTSFMRDLDKCIGVGKEQTGVYNKSANSDIDARTVTAAKPSLYYLFGRVNIAKRSFMVTEDDLLDYLHCWHDSDTRPERISKYLSDKFILILGCRYPNWLFRFFWHSLRNFSILPGSHEMQGVVSLEKLEDDRDLIRFLSRIQTSVFDSAEAFITELVERHRKRSERKSAPRMAALMGPATVEAPDIFISYAKEDYDEVRLVAEKIRALGASVWFDEKNLQPGDGYEDLINEKIEQCRRFIPFISRTTLQPGRRFFKKEWSKAIHELEFHLGEEFITPIALEGVERDNPAIPRAFRDFHIVSISDEDFDEKLKALIRSFR